MSDNPTPDGAPESGAPDGTEFKPITTQDDLNKVIAERISRERAKFADYKDVKAKADRLDSLEAANKSEAQKVAERIAALESENARIQSEALRSRIQAKHGISDEDADLFLTGTDEATLTRQAEALAGKAADRKKQSNVVPTEGKATPPPAGDEMREFTRGLFNRANTD